MTAVTISPRALTRNGRAPCSPRSRRMVRRPAPVNVSRKAHRLRLPRTSSCGLVKSSAATVALCDAPYVASSEMTRKPSTNFGIFVHGNVPLFCNCADVVALAIPGGPTARRNPERQSRSWRCGRFRRARRTWRRYPDRVRRLPGFGGVVDGESGPEAIGLV